MVPKYFGIQKLCLQLNNFTQKLDFEVLGLGEKERTRFRKKTKKKKLHRGKSGLVGMKRFLQTYNHVRIFCAALKPFLNMTGFYVKLSGQFSGCKTEVTKLIASKFGTSIQLQLL